MNRNALPAPSMGRFFPAVRVCGSCARPLSLGPISRVFPGHHARCIEKAVARAKSEQD